MDTKVNFHSSIIINDTIYIDPLRLTDCKPAKYIFVTHPHWDHFSIEDIDKIFDKGTTLICPQSMQKDVPSKYLPQTFFVEPNKKYNFADLCFETFPSYNTNKQFHPKANAWVGYTLEIGSKRVSIVGDSDNTSELQKLKTDILLLPIGGTYTMDVWQAAALTNLLRPQLVIPTHYGEVVGAKSLGNQFATLVDKDIQTRILLYSHDE